MRRLRIFPVRALALSIAMLVVLQASTLFAAQPSRRINAIDDAQRAPMSGNVSPRIRGASDLGELPGSQQLEQLTLRFSMSAAQEAALTQLLQDQQNPNSSRYHQ